MKSETYEKWLEEIVAEVGGRQYTRKEYYDTFVEGADPRAIYEQDRSMAAELEKSGAIVLD